MAIDVADLQIDREALGRRRSSWGLVAAVVIAGGGLGGWAWWRSRDASADHRPFRSSVPGRLVRTVLVPAPGAGGDVVGGGWLEAAPPAPVYVSARIAGTITELPLLPGDRVESGGLVARLDPTPWRLARERTVAEVDVVERRLSRLRAGSRAQEIAGAEAEVRATQSEVVRAERAFARARRLAPDGTVTKAQLDRAEADAAHAKAVKERAAARLALLRAGTRPETIAEAEAAVGVAQAALRRADQDLAWTEIRAVGAGVVLERFVQVGQRVAPARNARDRPPGAVCSLYDPTDIQVRVDLPQADAARVSVGDGATVSLAAAPGKRFDGRVVRIDPLADLAKNTVRVRVKLLATDSALRPDLTARVEFRTGGATAKTIRIPARCVVTDGDVTSVWQVTGGFAHRATVKLGATSGQEVLVEEGLAGGETLVLE
jgi:multidrug resistance efflux pump